MGNTDSSCGELESTLWQRACAMLPKPEQDELQLLIGEEATEENERLHAELASLLAILNRYRDESESIHRTRESTRRQLVGQQKLLLESHIRDMLENVRDVHNLSPESCRVATALMMERPTSSSRSSTAASTPFSLPLTSSPDSTISSSMSRMCSRPDLARYQNISLSSLMGIAHVEGIAADLRSLVEEERQMLLEELDRAAACIDGEISSRARLQALPEANVATLTSLKQELEYAHDRNQWSERLRRLPSGGRKKWLPDDECFPSSSQRLPKAGPGGGIAGVFAAVAQRDKDYSGPVAPPSPPQDGSPSTRSRQSPVGPVDAEEDARDWLALVESLSADKNDTAARDAALQLLENTHKKRGRKPGDDYLMGLDSDEG